MHALLHAYSDCPGTPNARDIKRSAELLSLGIYYRNNYRSLIESRRRFARNFPKIEQVFCLEGKLFHILFNI